MPESDLVGSAATPAQRPHESPGLDLATQSLRRPKPPEGLVKVEANMINGDERYHLKVINDQLLPNAAHELPTHVVI